MGRILHNFQCLNYKGVPTNWSFTVLAIVNLFSPYDVYIFIS